MINIFVAMDEKRGIGYKGDLLTYLPGDLPRFKKFTTGNSVIMGRKTYDSLRVKPLPNRENIVITRNRDLKIDGVKVVYSLKEAIDIADKGKEIFIIGGGQIYLEAINLCDRLYITHIHKEFKADTYFPEIPKQFKEREREDIDEDPELRFSYVVYER